MNRFYYTSENKIILTGDTFSIKEEIKKAGGKWDSSQKSWWILNNEISIALLKKLGFSLNSKNEPIQPNHLASIKQFISLDIPKENEYKTMNVAHFVLFIESVIKKNLSSKYWICGEISGFKTSNGHTFFDLIDKEERSNNSFLSLKAASIPCIIWANKKQLLNDKITKILFQDGTKIKILVSCDFRKEGTRISAIIDNIDIQHTQGELALQRIAIVQELKKRGLYHKNKKLKIKEFPLKIALLTAENSRAAADFLNELKLSKISFQITLFDCNMQGEKTSDNITNALRFISLNSDLFDCIIITRGGGSRLDLRWFDDLKIAMQIAISKLPVITAVGHFDDISIADEVSFHCEKTPTAAARFLTGNISQSLNVFVSRLEKVTNTLLRKTSKEKQYLSSLKQRLSNSACRRIEIEKKHLNGFSQLLKVFQSSITQTLNRGYAIVYNKTGKLVTGKDFLSHPTPDSLKLEFANDCGNQHIFVDVSVNGITHKSNQS